MKNVFSNTLFQIICLVVLVVVFWAPIMFDNEFFYDDFAFIDTFKAGTPSIGYFLKPHNEHFMPMFKGVFYSMYKVFGLNISPFMGLAIIIHIINSILLFFLLKTIFDNKKFLPFLLTLFFALNTTYFEILHWFTNTGQAIMFFFLLLTLLLFHLSERDNNKKLYYWSLCTSFFIPMNFSLGFLGVFFISLYYFFVLKGRDIKKLLPFFAVWLAYFAMYLFFSLYSVMHQPRTAPPMTFRFEKILLYMALGVVGLFIKNMGFSMLVFPYTTGFAAVLTIISLLLGFILLLYFFLNKKFDRIPIFSKNPIAAFSLVSIFVCYLVLALGRASLEPEAFLNWGRYHYIPMFFLTLLFGAIIPKIMDIFGKIFDRGRLKVFFIIIFIFFLMTQFVLLRQKAQSPVRTEGSIISSSLSFS